MSRRNVAKQIFSDKDTDLKMIYVDKGMAVSIYDMNANISLLRMQKLHKGCSIQNCTGQILLDSNLYNSHN